MIVMYHRSSSLGTLEMCEMKYFFQYVLGMKDKTNKKAVLGTIFHRSMQVLADKKLAQTNGKEIVENDDIRNLTFDECDDIESITRLCFDYYKKHEEDVGLSNADLKTCIGWMHKALAYNNGIMDPRRQNIYATEKFFDIEIKHRWASYDYKVGDNYISGNLAIRGTIDLIIKEDEDYFQVLDYKTGQRLNWATGEQKSYDDLKNDKQLLLYYYALKNLYPDKNFYISIYYVNDGGVFDLVFTNQDYEKAENMLRKKFEHIKSVKVPLQLSNDQQNWKCTRLCRFSEVDPSYFGKTTCQMFHDMIRKEGMDYVVSKFADLKKLGKYGSGGGRIDT